MGSQNKILGPRSIARDATLKTLYAWEISKFTSSIAECHALLTRETSHYGKATHEASFGFACDLLIDAFIHWTKINETIDILSTDWLLKQMPMLDRNIMRLAVCELLEGAETPAGVIITEAGKLADKYSTGESRRFVEAALTVIAKEIRKKEIA